jgi:hypothetical protein
MFAAFHLVISLVPYSIVLGATGVISFGLISGPLIGFLLGPVYGPVSVLLGSFLATAIDPALAVIGPFTPLATGAGALAAGALRSPRPRLLLIIYVGALVAFLLGPIGGTAAIFLVPHAFGLAILAILTITNATKGVSDRIVHETDTSSGVLSVFVVSFVAVMLDNAIGNSIASYYFVYIVGADPTTMTGIFLGALFIYPIERVVAAIVITLLYVVVRTAMIRTDLDLLSTRFDDEDQQSEFEHNLDE